MKMIITESQYSTLLRRFSLSQIEDKFRYRLESDNPCRYLSFDDFFNSVSHRTSKTILARLDLDDKLDFDTEKVDNFKNIIYDFVYDNFSDEGKRYYNKYRKSHCPYK
jgi:hypothetical protein